MLIHVDPASGIRQSLQASLAGSGIDIHSLSTYEEAQATLETEETIHLVVTEYDLGEGTGLDFISQVRQTHPDATCILFTKESVDEIDTRDYEATILEYVEKGQPEAMAQLEAMVRAELAGPSQASYPKPENERTRLEAVDRYPLESADLEASLDRLTELAAAFFDIDRAFTAILGETEERFLSCYNADYERFSRQDTICTFTILADSVTVIEDTQADPRFNRTELYAEEGIRFYSGAPLVTEDGQAIGTFCLIDDEPRSFSTDEEEHLRLFADAAMEQFDLHRELTELREARP